MLSRPANISLGQMANNYFEKDAYYQTEKAGEWHGKGAQDFGLKAGGEVDYQQFMKMGAGYAPDANIEIDYDKEIRDAKVVDHSNGADTPLVHAGVNGERRAAVDLTFAPGKSVSIAAEFIDPRFKEWHTQAVKEALDYAEKEYAGMRVTRDGKTETAHTGKFVAALFQHSTSRELDMQLHTHAVVMNMTVGKDGKARALDNSKLFDNHQFLGQMYRNLMAEKAVQNGYAIEVTNAKQGFWELKGIPNEVVDHFSQRSGQIKAAIGELRGKYPNASDSKLKELATLGTRASKKDVNLDDVKDAWNERLEKLGFTKEGLQASMKQASLEQGAAQKNLLKANSHELVKVESHILTETESIFSKEEVLKIAGRLGLEQGMTIEKLETAFASMVGTTSRGEFHALKGEGNLFTTKEMLSTHKSNMKALAVGREVANPVMTEKQAETFLADYGNLTDGQREAAKLGLTSKDRISGIQGHAGAGKSVAFNVIKEGLEEQGQRVIALAPTTKAVSALKEKGIEQAETLQKFLSRVESKSIAVVDEQDVKALQVQYDDIKARFSSAELKSLEKDYSKEQALKAAETSLLNMVTKAVIGRIIHQNIQNKWDLVYGEDGTMKVAKTEKHWLKDIAKNTLKYLNPMNWMEGKTFTSSKAAFKIYRDGTAEKTVTKQEVTRWGMDGAKIISYTAHKDGSFTVFEGLKSSDAFLEKNFHRVASPDTSALLRGKTTIIVDEASMVGEKDMLRLNNLAERVNARIILGGDVNQLKSISAGDIFRDYQNAGMKTAQVEEIKRQKDPEYLKMTTALAGKKVVDALQIADNKGWLIEVSDKDERFASIAKKYVSEKNEIAAEVEKEPNFGKRKDLAKRDVLIVTSKNSDKQEINRHVRDALKAEGKLKDGQFVIVLESTRLHGTEKHFAGSYKPGQIIYALAHLSGMKAGQKGIVKEVDLKRNALIVEDLSGKKSEINLTKYGNKIAAYESRKIEMAVGDKIVFEKPDKKLGLDNGDTAYIKSVSDKGDITVVKGNGKERSFNIKQHPFITHGYAVTHHKAQGETVHSVITNVSRESFNALYVANTRATERVANYTDSKEALFESAQLEQEKHSLAGKVMDLAGAAGERGDKELERTRPQETDGPRGKEEISKNNEISFGR